MAPEAGIEPAHSVLETEALPLSYTGICNFGAPGMDSNLHPAEYKTAALPIGATRADWSW